MPLHGREFPFVPSGHEQEVSVSCPSSLFLSSLMMSLLFPVHVGSSWVLSSLPGLWLANLLSPFSWLFHTIYVFAHFPALLPSALKMSAVFLWNVDKHLQCFSQENHKQNSHCHKNSPRANCGLNTNKTKPVYSWITCLGMAVTDQNMFSIEMFSASVVLLINSKL